MSLHKFHFLAAALALSPAVLQHARAQQSLPDAPSAVLAAQRSDEGPPKIQLASTAPPSPAVSPGAQTDILVETSTVIDPSDAFLQQAASPSQQSAAAPQQTSQTGQPGQPLDANGKPIPLNRYEPDRLFGFMPNFRSVSAGAAVHPPGWKYNFSVATHQAFDYSSFIFLGLTSLSAEGLNEHPALGKGADGFYAYAWRGFLDKTDGNYLGGWLLPSLLHEDTRYYPLGDGHNPFVRELYVISRQGVTRTYGGQQTPNIAGLGGKVLAQIVSRTYYPAGSSDFGVLAEKFGYATMRDVIFTSIREFYPDIAAYYVRRHRAKAIAHSTAASSTAAN